MVKNKKGTGKKNIARFALIPSNGVSGPTVLVPLDDKSALAAKKAGIPVKRRDYEPNRKTKDDNDNDYEEEREEERVQTSQRIIRRRTKTNEKKRGRRRGRR